MRAPRLVQPAFALAALLALGLSAGSFPAGSAPVDSAQADIAPASPAQAATYSQSLREAVEDLQLADEVRAGYSRDEFEHWIDADGDGCDARREVLIAEADDPVSVGSGCTLSGGRWFSYYDRVDVHDDSDADIDHMVPLAEAWDSGARSWAASTRESFANDLGDYRSLVGVTASSNRSKGDRDPAEWMPTYYKCRYLQQWVAVKHRWRLAVDSRERTALRTEVDDLGCSNVTITVTLAR